MTSFSFEDVRAIQLGERSDAGNVERFAQCFESEVLHVPGVGWHRWNGTMWKLDEMNDALDLTGHVAAQVLTEYHGDESLTDVQLRDWRQHFKYTSSLRGRKAILELAGVDSRLKCHVSALNSDPWSLVLPNGTLDLKTQTLRESRAEDRNTLCGGVLHDKDATSPQFDALLEYAFPGDPAMQAYVLRVLGYMLTGIVSEQALFFLWGMRGSAKSTLCEIMLHLLGSYASALPENALTGSGNEHPTWIVDLTGKRMVYQDELNERAKLNTGRINRLTGTEIAMKGRKMGKDFVDITIKAKIMISTNHRPRMGSIENGIWRRLQPWHFKHAISDDKRIRDYSRLLVEQEGSGILNRCLAGLQDFLYGGLGLAVPQIVVDGAKDYQESEDTLTAFIEDHFINTGDPTHWIANVDIFAAYESWCTASGVKQADALSGQQLTERMSDAGFQRMRDDKGKTKVIKAQRPLQPGSKPQRGFIGIQFAEDAYNLDTPRWLPVTPLA